MKNLRKRCFPIALPLPSSPIRNPKDGSLLVIVAPSKKHELEPVPKMQTIAGLPLYAEYAAAVRSSLTKISAFGKAFCISSCTMALFSATPHPEP